MWVLEVVYFRLLVGVNWMVDLLGFADFALVVLIYVCILEVFPCLGLAVSFELLGWYARVLFLIFDCILCL